METMQFHILKMNFIFRTIFLAFKWSYSSLWHAHEIALVSLHCRFNYPQILLGYWLFQWFSDSIFEVFINIHEYANEIIFI